MMVSVCCSARSSSAVCSALMRPSRSSIAWRRYRRTSVATWSLRERPVCRRLPASPTSAVSALLDVQVHVFQIERPDEFAGDDLVLDLRQAALDVAQVLRGDDVAGRQHLRVRQRTLDVEHGQLVIEAHRRGIALHQFRHRFVKTPRPASLFLSCIGSCISAPTCPIMKHEKR